MKCVNCGMELNASMIKNDGTLECPSCGAVYRKKKSPTSDSQQKTTNNKSSRQSDQPLRDDTKGTDMVRSSLNRAAQYGKSVMDNIRDDPNVQKATEIYRDGKEKAVAGAVNAYKTGKASARRAINSATRNISQRSHKRFLVPIILVLIAAIGIGVGAYTISNKPKDGGPTEFVSVETSRIDDEKKTDTLSSMIVSKDQAQSVGGVYILSGGSFVDVGKQQRDALLRHCPTYWHFNDWSYLSVFQYRDFQIPCYSSGDTLVVFSNSSVPELELYAIVDSSYTIGIFRTTTLSGGEFIDIDDMTRLPNDLNKVTYSPSDTDHVTVYPLDLLINEEPLVDKTVEGYVPLNKGESVTLSWYTGTQYHETEKQANYQYYIHGEDPIKLAGTLSKNGYAEYDLSGVPSGLYWINGRSQPSASGLIEIK